MKALACKRKMGSQGAWSYEKEKMKSRKSRENISAPQLWQGSGRFGGRGASERCENTLVVENFFFLCESLKTKHKKSSPALASQMPSFWLNN